MLFISIFKHYSIIKSFSTANKIQWSAIETHTLNLWWLRQESLSLLLIGYPQSVLKVLLFYHQVSCSAILSNF